MARTLRTSFAVLAVLAVCAVTFRTAAAQAPTGLYCAAPSQFEGTMLVVEAQRGPKHPPRIVNWSYDFADRRERFDWLTGTGAIARTIIQKEIAGIAYQYDIAPSGDCSYRELPDGMQQIGVADDFLSEADFTIGGELEASRFMFAADHRGNKPGAVLVVAKKTCIPIFFQGDARAQKLVYRDITVGIRNPNVFNTPPSCVAR